MIKISHDIDIATLTTFGIHARAAAVATYSTPEELKSILRDERLPRPLKHIGEGSNLLFTEDFPGTLIIADCRQASFDETSDDVIHVTASAGLPMDNLCRMAAERGFRGIENLSGIPGTVGAAVVQNIGAYGVEFCDVMEEASAIDSVTGEIRRYVRDEMEYGYRHSLLKTTGVKGRYYIYEVKLKLAKDREPKLDYGNLRQMLGEDSPTPEAIRRAVIKMRDSKLPDPKVFGNAGSFFKNPVISKIEFERVKTDHPELDFPSFVTSNGGVKIPAAFLIDQCGFKGMVKGNAAVWSKQPLVLVNQTGHATGMEIVALENEIVDTVYRKFGIELEPEVEHIP